MPDTVAQMGRDNFLIHALQKRDGSKELVGYIDSIAVILYPFLNAIPLSFRDRKLTGNLLLIRLHLT